MDTHKQVKLPPIITKEIPYTLSAKHWKLYKDVTEAELEALPEDKMELAVNSMFSTLQRLVVAPEEFGLMIKSPILDYLDSYLGQIGDEGVILFTRHKVVSKMLMDYVPDSQAIYGDLTKKTKDKAMEDVKSGKCKRLIANMDSVATGVNLQMLNRIVYIELPFRDDKFTQATGRIHRQGQSSTCFIDIPLAKNTIQEQIYFKLLKNKENLKKILQDRSALNNFLDSTK